MGAIDFRPALGPLVKEVIPQPAADVKVFELQDCPDAARFTALYTPASYQYQYTEQRHYSPPLSYVKVQERLSNMDIAVEAARYLTNICNKRGLEGDTWVRNYLAATGAIAVFTASGLLRPDAVLNSLTPRPELFDSIPLHQGTELQQPTTVDVYHHPSYATDEFALVGCSVPRPGDKGFLLFRTALTPQKAQRKAEDPHPFLYDPGVADPLLTRTVWSQTAEGLGLSNCHPNDAVRGALTALLANAVYAQRYVATSGGEYGIDPAHWQRKKGKKRQ